MDIYRFSNIELRVATREVVLDGHLVDLEPRAFDLLIYLIENRSRVVSKDELLDKVWHTAYVSESVLARAVMKLRKALAGDPEDAYVRTAHRIGYRFVGEIDSPAAQTHATPARAESSLALLPIINQTGDDSLAWVELGLLTLIVRAVAEASRVSLVPIASVLTALQGIPANIDARQRQVMLAGVLGCDRMVQIAVGPGPASDFDLAWTLWKVDLLEREGHLQGTQLTDLALQFARQLVAMIGEKPVPVAVDTLSADEEFANAAHARAMQAFARERYPNAVALMRACTDIEPHTRRMDIDLAAMLVVTNPTEAARRCAELLAKHRDELSPSDLSALYGALANLAFHDKNWEECEAYCAAAARLSVEEGNAAEPEWVAQTRLKVALIRNENNYARHTAQVILARARADRDQVRVAQALANLGWQELDNGDQAVGTSILTEAIELARTHKLNATHSLCLNELGRHMRKLGRPDRAIELFLEAVELNRVAGYVVDTAQVYANLYRAHVDIGDREQALSCIAEIDHIVADIGRSNISLRATRIDALMRFESDDRAHAEALKDLGAMVEKGEPHWSLGHYLIVLVASGDLAAAKLWLEKVEPLMVESNSMAYTTCLAAVAQIRYADGELAKARKALDDHVRMRGGVLGSTLVATDLLWVTMEEGRIDDATGLASAVEQHLHHTLRGRVTYARLCYHQGALADARAIQHQVVAASNRHRALPYLSLLSDFYNAKPSTRKKTFPVAPALPSAF